MIFHFSSIGGAAASAYDGGATVGSVKLKNTGIKSKLSQGKFSVIIRYTKTVSDMCNTLLHRATKIFGGRQFSGKIYEIEKFKQIKMSKQLLT